MFAFSAFPLLPGDGQRWLSVYLDEPRLVPKAGAALRHLLTGAPLPPLMDRRDIWPLALFAMGTIISLAAVVLTVGVQLGIWLEAEMAGAGVSLFLLLVAAFLTWLVILRITIGRRMGRFRETFGGAMGAGLAQEPVDPMLGRVVDPQRRRAAVLPPAMAAAAPVVVEQAPSAAPRVVWGMILAGLLAVAFLPYDYEAGGSVEFLPAARAQAVARTSGEVVEILVAEGDIVTRGQLLARLSSWDQENGIKVTQAMLEGAEANLARLQAGAKPEELELATRELERARVSLSFSEAEANRARELVATGTISQQAYEAAIAAYDADLAGLEVAQANLDLVRSGATEEEIAIATAEVARLTEELAFRQDELARTRIEAPMDGRVITADLELRHGAFLTVGETLVEIEDAATITAMIAVPEADIALIAPGDAVRLRIWGQGAGEITGTVRDIAPVASGTTQGNVVQVEASFANEAGLLRSGMTGYAKVDGAEMRVWEAYLRSIRRFFEIEVWSWIP
jgi:multidrug resistance efflux pump